MQLSSLLDDLASIIVDFAPKQKLPQVMHESNLRMR